MFKATMILLGTLLFVGTAHGDGWHCGVFTKYAPYHAIYGIIGDLNHGPAIVNGTKDPKGLKYVMAHGYCYCVKGNTSYTKKFGNTFKKIMNVDGCYGVTLPRGEEPNSDDKSSVTID